MQKTINISIVTGLISGYPSFWLVLAVKTSRKAINIAIAAMLKRFKLLIREYIGFFIRKES